MIAGCSSGVEPIFALAFEHRVKQRIGERVLTFVNETFERIAKEQGFYSDALMQEIVKRGSLHVFAGSPSTRPRCSRRRTRSASSGTCATRRRSAHTDNGVSRRSTCRNNAPEDDVARAYRLAWELGLPRHHRVPDGCKGEQVLNVGVSRRRQGSGRDARRAGRHQASAA